MNHKIFALLCVGLLLSTGAIAVMGLPDETDATVGTNNNRVSSIYTTLNGFMTGGTYYVFVGAYVSVPSTETIEGVEYTITGTPNGVGLSITGGYLTGYISVANSSIDVSVKNESTSTITKVTINSAYQTGTNVSLYNGSAWEYYLETNLAGATYNLISNAAGMNIVTEQGDRYLTWTPSSDGSFKAVVTFTTTNPHQCAIQTINFTVTTPITPVASVSGNGTLYLVAGGSVPNSLREQVTTYTNLTNATWTIEGTNNTGVLISSTGVFSGTAVNSSGTHTLLLKAVSGDNAATCALTVSIVAKLAITSTPTGV